MENLTKEKSNLIKAAGLFLIIISVYFVVRIANEFKNYGANKDMGLITLSGHGEMKALPDIATVYFTISKDAKTVKEAQDEVAQIEKLVLDLLKKNKVADKDIKTENASFYPKYRWVSNTVTLPCVGGDCPITGENVIVGYTASESITVKVRQIDDAGKIIQGLGETGVSNLNGPSFMIDDEDLLKAEARKKAIEDAKEKAEVLAKDLGVRLVRVTNFNESGNYAYPMMYSSKDMMNARAESAPASLPKGENTISSDVTITYEIR